MKTLLHFDSSPLSTSITREMTREFVKAWKGNHPDGQVFYRDFAQDEKNRETFLKPTHDEVWAVAA